MPKLSPTAAKAIDAFIAESVSDPHHNLPRAVVMVTTKEGLIYTGADGYAQLPPYDSPASAFESAEKITKDSVFEMWSCTKLVTVVAALQLLELGKLDLAADASIYVPALKEVEILDGYEGDKPILRKNEQIITLEQLITHTAGFAYSGDDTNREIYRIANNIPAAGGPDATTESITKMPLSVTPGTTWIYSTANDWLALCVEAASGQELGAYVQEHIFGPLGMTELSYELLDRNCINIAITPTPASGPYTTRPGVKWANSRAFGGHGLLGSPDSYIKLLRVILNGGTVDGKQILRPESVTQMFSPHLNATQQIALKERSKSGSDPFTRRRDLAEYEENAKGPQWGFGGVLSQEDLSSGRKAGSLYWSGMASTYWVIDPATEIAFVIFTNVVPYGPEQIWDLWEKVEVELYKGLSA
ncbi:hypothetical protein P7C70_g2051, partial [Phenoliferia sp. Uapishka_3]